LESREAVLHIRVVWSAPRVMSHGISKGDRQEQAKVAVLDITQTYKRDCDSERTQLVPRSNQNLYSPTYTIVQILEWLHLCFFFSSVKI